MNKFEIKKVDKQKYIIFYKKLRELIHDEEIFPSIEEPFLKRFISSKNWLGIPSFGVLSKEELTNKPHLSMNLRKENIVDVDIFYNGKGAVEQFCNILRDFSGVEKEQFIDAFKKLDDNYSYELLYDERVGGSSADWKLEYEGVCNQLNDEEVEKLLSRIKGLTDKRNSEQEFLQPGYIATIAVKLAKVEVDTENNEQIIEAFSKLITLLKILINIKSTPQINKLKREIELRRKETEEEIQRIRDRLQFQDKHPGLARATEEQITQNEKRLRELKEELKLTDAGKIARL